MSGYAKDLSAEPLQLYSVDARSAQPATGERFCRNRKNKRFYNQSLNTQARCKT